jgi:hypothetical protein
VPSSPRGGYDYEQCNAPPSRAECCGCLVTIKLQQNPDQSGISWMSFIYDDGETRDVIRYGKKVRNRPDLMLEPIQVVSCATPLSRVFQYQYGVREGGDLGFGYVFWFDDCAPQGSPYKIVLYGLHQLRRGATSPGLTLQVTERSYITRGDRIFKLSFDYDSTRQEYTLTGGETVPNCIECD